MHSGLIGVIVAFGLTCGAIAVGASPLFFLHIPSLTFCVGVPIGLGIMSCGLRDCLKAVAALRVLVLNSPDHVALQRSAKVLRQLISYTYAAGAVGTMIGWLQLAIAGAEGEDLLASFAVSILTIFYAFIVSEFVLRPTACRIESGVKT